MRIATKFLGIAASLSMALFWAGCVSSAASGAGSGGSRVPQLDEAVRQAADLIGRRAEAGAKIAILNFQSPSARFSEYFINELEADLIDNGKLTVINRGDIDRVRGEMALQISGEAGDGTMRAAGQKLKARLVVSGQLMETGDTYRVIVRVLDVETAAVAAQYRSDIRNDERVRVLVADRGEESGAQSAQAQPHAPSQPGSSAPAVSPPPVPAASAPASGTGGSPGEYFFDLRDGQKYRTVKIGKYVWMAENLNCRTGDSWCYGNDSANCGKYGRLYDWNAALKACPNGWRLPGKTEWNDLIIATGGAVRRLKSKTDWYEHGKGTDEYGWSALPGGFHLTASGNFQGVGNYGGWWSSAGDRGGSSAYYWGMLYNDEGVRERASYMSDGFSVRCIRND